MLKHIWDKHSLESGFTHICGISSLQLSFQIFKVLEDMSQKNVVGFLTKTWKFTTNANDETADKNAVSLELLCNEHLSLNDDNGDHDELLVVNDEKIMKNLIICF